MLKLRDAHNREAFDEFDYCKNCDFLYEEPESLVWTNDKTAGVGQVMGASKDFNLHKYNFIKIKILL